MSEEKDIQKEAEKVLEELSVALGDIDLEETYYVVEDINVTRSDGEPHVSEEFKETTKKNAPRLDKEGSFITEIGKWVK
ncbi:MAG: Asp-tRNA(Asn) amidotransferase subunit GatC [Candidatus Hydrothermarchaeales archaeon]